MEDSPESFAEGIDHLYRNIQDYNAEGMKHSVEKYNWQNIVDDMKATSIDYSF